MKKETNDILKNRELYNPYVDDICIASMVASKAYSDIYDAAMVCVKIAKDTAYLNKREYEYFETLTEIVKIQKEAIEKNHYLLEKFKKENESNSKDI